MTFKQFLTNSQMGKVVASFLKQEALATNAEGKMDLSAENEQKLTTQFGAKFVEILKDKSFSSTDENAHELFQAASDHVRNVTSATYQQKITELQNTVATLASQPEVDPPAAAPIGAKTQNHGFKANMALNHNAMYSAFVQTGGVMNASATIDAGSVTQELGPYLSQGNNLDMLEGLYNSFTTAKFLTWKRAVTEYKSVLSQAIDLVVQQFSSAWTPKGTAKFTALTIKNYRHKVDFAIDPTEVGESWLFHLYDEKQAPDQMPITRYIIEKVLLPKIAENVELVMTSKAKYVEGSTKTEETMNGIETQLVMAKASLDKGIHFFRDGINLLAKETTDAQVVDTINDYVASIAPLYRAMKMPVFLSGDVYLRYKRGYQAKWRTGGGSEKADFGQDRVDFTNCYLQVLDCLNGSPIVFSTPPENFIGLKHKNPPQFISDIQKHDREVRVYIEFWYGLGFLIGEAVFAIVPDGYDPSKAIGSTRLGDPTKWITKATTETQASAEGGNSDAI